jgi:hypothetical protein
VTGRALNATACAGSARIASTRHALAEDLEGIGEALDVTSRLRSSFRLHPLAWVAGAVGVGMLAATLFAIFIIPVTFYIVEKLSGSQPGAADGAAKGTNAAAKGGG